MAARALSPSPPPTSDSAENWADLSPNPNLTGTPLLVQSERVPVIAKPVAPERPLGWQPPQAQSALVGGPEQKVGVGRDGNGSVHNPTERDTGGNRLAPTVCKLKLIHRAMTSQGGNRRVTLASYFLKGLLMHCYD